MSYVEKRIVSLNRSVETDAGGVRRSQGRTHGAVSVCLQLIAI